MAGDTATLTSTVASLHPLADVGAEVLVALNEKRFPELICELYRIVGELEIMFPGRPFTPDGHMVGSLAECYAEYYYGLSLYACSNAGHDAHNADCKVEIKATQGKRVSLRSGPERLLVLRLRPNGTFEEVYNGPGAPVWALVEKKPKPSNGQYQVTVGQLSRLMSTIPEHQRLPMVSRHA
jgi:hypothetical protein